MSKLTLAELEEQSGVTARTIRYYISQGLLPKPDRKGGPRVSYDGDILSLLGQIQTLKEQGMSLDEIKEFLYRARGDVVSTVTSFRDRRQAALGLSGGTLDRSRDTWKRFRVGDDVEVSVRASISPEKWAIISRAYCKFAQAIENAQKGENPHG